MRGDFPLNTLAHRLEEPGFVGSSAWRLLFLPVVLGALLLVGSPDFPALTRALEKAFAADAPATSTANVETTARPPKPEERRREATRNESRGPWAPKPEGRRWLVPLYVSFAALQALDAHSTLRALNAGAAEANPLMGGLAGKPAALVATKAAVAASTIYLADKVRVKNRTAAIALMAALNALYASIVVHNYGAVP
jgi:hypothetical protein